MRTRSGPSYPSPSDGITFFIRPSKPSSTRTSTTTTAAASSSSPRLHLLPPPSSRRRSSSSPLDSLHDDLLLSILSRLSSSASRPSDLINAMLTCKRLCAAVSQPEVLALASSSAISVHPTRWSPGAKRYLQRCAASGNVDAAYTLGMILFYCEKERLSGVSLMARAAMRGHAAALHSLAIIQFNGSGRSRKDAKDLRRGVRLCVRAAALGHVGAMRELGHCLLDGYGVTRSAANGRRLLIEANAREAAAAGGASVVASVPGALAAAAMGISKELGERCCRCLLSDFAGAAAATAAPPPPPEARQETASGFLVGWFKEKPPEAGLRMCSHRSCGRPETRRHEFRRCSACGAANYCSRSCQSLDWKLRHKMMCAAPFAAPPPPPPPT